jgi:hypothetical protein
VEHFGILLAILLFAFYFLPTIIAEKRKVPHSGTIFLINLFLGWTVLGWIAALVWGVVETPEEPGTFKAPLDHVG